MARQLQVHHPVDMIEAARVEPQKMRRERGDPGAQPGAMGGQVAMPPGAAFAPAGDALIGVDAQIGAVEPVEFEPPA